MEFNKDFVESLIEKAWRNPRLRINYDLRTSSEDNSQRMLNALLPETNVPIHRHPMSSENVICLYGRLDEIFYDDKGNEIIRYHLCPVEGNYGCQIPKGVWHTVEVLEPSIIYEGKDGKYGDDGSQSFPTEMRDSINLSHSSKNEYVPFSNALVGNLKKNIEYLIGMERQSGSMECITPLYVSRMLNVSLEDVERQMRDMGLI